MSDLPLVNDDADRIGRLPVVDDNGDRLGYIQALYTDEGAATLEWALVHTGLVGASHLVPLSGALVTDHFLQVGYDKGRVHDAPRVDAEGDTAIGPELEQALYRHYGLPWEDEPEGGGDVPATGAGARRALVTRPSLLTRLAYS